MPKRLDVNDYVGKTFHYLTVLSEHSVIKTKSYLLTYVNCICKCGEHTVKDLKSIKRGNTKSCGCLIKEVHSVRGIDKRVKFISKGDVFGNLIVLYEIENSSPRTVQCRCVCGVEKSYRLNNLTRGTTKSCGCLKNINSPKNGLKNRRVHINRGEVFERLTVIKEVEGIQYGEKTRLHRQFECRCECGNITIVSMRNLRGGRTNSCGCYKKERQIETVTKHNQHTTPEYRAWVSMKQRCYNPNISHFKHYGGRGVSVCDRWLESFDNFYEDMGPKPSPSHSIDRIDNYKLIDGYSKDNCRWATKSEQIQNRRIMD